MNESNDSVNNDIKILKLLLDFQNRIKYDNAIHIIMIASPILNNINFLIFLATFLALNHSKNKYEISDKNNNISTFI